MTDKHRDPRYLPDEEHEKKREDQDDPFAWLAPCCENEKRNMRGGCDNCGDPCL